jgi:hypothetical protein
MGTHATRADTQGTHRTHAAAYGWPMSLDSDARTRAVLPDLTPSQRGAVAEAEIAARAIRLGLVVLRPLAEGARYDLVIDSRTQLLRVQCKWAARRGNVLTVCCQTSRHTPGGYVRSTYSSHEVDAIGAYAPDTGRCYLIPIGEIDSHCSVSLRIAPTGNNQALQVRWARDYEFLDSLVRNWRVKLETPERLETSRPGR